MNLRTSCLLANSISLLFFLVTTKLPAQNAWQRALSPIGMNTQSSCNVFYQPQCLLPDSQRTQIQADLNLFHNIPSLHRQVISAAHSMGKMRLGMGVQSRGNEGLKEEAFGLAISHKIDWMTLGMGITIKQWSALQHGQTWIVYVHVGGQMVLHPKIKASLTAKNISFQKLSSYETDFIQEKPSLELCSGLAYQLSSKSTFYVDAAKNLTSPAQYAFGLSYKVHPALSLAGGISWPQAEQRLGFAFKTHEWTWMAQIGYQAAWGWNGTYSVAFHIPEKSSNKLL